VILAAYHQLAAEGLVSLRFRSGVFVRAQTPSADTLLPEVASWVVDILLRGLGRGIPVSDLGRQASVCLGESRVGAVCLECNSDQIYALSRQLVDDYGFEATGIEIDRLGRRQSLPRKASDADLVLTTPFHVAEAQRLGRRLRRPVLVATLDPLFMSELRRMLARGPVWWICVDARFASKLRQMWPGSPVRPVVLGSDALDAIPAEAMVYATRAASERLPPGWREGSVVTIPRVFSVDTARALLAFRVRHSLQAAAAGFPARL
jgi:hypothetical protein